MNPATDQNPQQPNDGGNKNILNELDLWKTIAARRQAFDSLVWQTAGFALSAQAFLYIIALNGGNVPIARVIALTLSLSSALATIQLMNKHRFHERLDAEFLVRIEQPRGLDLHGPRTKDKENKPFWIKWSAVNVWLGLQRVFFFISTVVLISVICSSAFCGVDPLATPKPTQIPAIPVATNQVSIKSDNPSPIMPPRINTNRSPGESR